MGLSEGGETGAADPRAGLESGLDTAWPPGPTTWLQISPCVPGVSPVAHVFP